MSSALDPQLKRALAERIKYYHELGIYDFYRRPLATELAPSPDAASRVSTAQEQMKSRVDLVAPAGPEENIFEAAVSKPESGISDPAKALRIIREDLGDCTRCKLHKLGRKQIVFGVGNPRAELIFVGEGPGADEDQQGEPFVGRAGQLLTEIITKGMKLRRQDVYIANIIKCRPPENRNPEPDEIAACQPFLLRQLDLI